MAKEIERELRKNCSEFKIVYECVGKKFANTNLAKVNLSEVIDLHFILDF